MLEQELLESQRRGSGVQILINKDGAAAALAPGDCPRLPLPMKLQACMATS